MCIHLCFQSIYRLAIITRPKANLRSFRGAAPLQHQLLAGETRTGVTLQTLDHGKFDHGIVLAQTEPPGIVIPPRCSYIKLLQMVTPKAAEILVNGLRDGLYLPPFVDIGKHHKDPLKVAPKITPEDRRIDWSNWDATTIIRQARALGKPWTVLQDFKGKKLRVVFEDVNGVDLNDFEHLPHQESLTAEDDITDHKEHTALCPTLNFLAISTGDLERRITCCVRGDAMIFIDGNGDAMSVREMTVEGKPTKCARLVMSSFVATPLKTEDTRQLKKIPAS
jgi:methionyl-tRNA formyltransferase